MIYETKVLLRGTVAREPRLRIPREPNKSLPEVGLDTEDGAIRRPLGSNDSNFT